METYKVYEAVEKVTTTGKKLKKLVLQKDGAQYPTKNVTMWSDHPQYTSTIAGGTLVCDLLEKDSGRPNPNVPGKNYTDRTVINPERSTVQPVASATTPNLTEMAIKTHIDRKFDALKYDLKVIADHLGVEAPKEPEPTVAGSDTPYPTPESQEISPDEIPF